MKVSEMLILLVSCCAVALACGLPGCGSDTAENQPKCEDADGDGYGYPSSRACVHAGLDCDDNNADVHPRAPEFCDGIDNQCPGDPGYGVVDDDALCRCSFQGGSYLFGFAVVGDAGDCPGSYATDLFPPGTQVGPIELPGFQELASSTPTAEIPFGLAIGTISVRFFSGGDDIRLEGTESIQVSIQGVPTATATVAGFFCPDREGGVLADLVVSIASDTPDVSCDLFMEAHGTAPLP